ncbi:hypothetical protein HMPREF1554_01274 [Porphyromonas gingivalis F0569]|nr:hypothetical protein HMPREF1554_01274 [Porphyromonas gingivalis F0569]ERJ68443.1 hypothetical protein HMPREF1553_01057 [Porphyromonas gingivalis F0568]
MKPSFLRPINLGVEAAGEASQTVKDSELGFGIIGNERTRMPLKLHHELVRHTL